MPVLQLSTHLLPRQSNSYYYNSVGGPGPIAGIVIGLIIVIALAVFGGCTLNRQRKRRRENEARLERQRKWYEADMQRERAAAAVTADENARREVDGLDGLDGRADVGEVARVSDPPPQYEGPAVPLRTLNPAVVR
jgi:hypothetical protein